MCFLYCRTETPEPVCVAAFVGFGAAVAFGVGVAVAFGAAVSAALVGSGADVPPFPSVSPHPEKHVAAIPNAINTAVNFL